MFEVKARRRRNSQVIPRRCNAEIGHEERSSGFVLGVTGHLSAARVQSLGVRKIDAFASLTRAAIGAGVVCKHDAFSEIGKSG